MTDVLLKANFLPAGRPVEAMRARLRDLSPFFVGVAEPILTSFFLQQFATKGAAGGQPWAPLKPSTVRARTRGGIGGGRLFRKAKRGQARGGILAILIDTRRLWSSYVKAGGPESIRIVTRFQYVRGSAVPYAGAHHEEDIVHKRPARKVVVDPLPPWVIILLERGLASYVTKGKIGAGKASKIAGSRSIKASIASRHG